MKLVIRCVFKYNYFLLDVVVPDTDDGWVDVDITKNIRFSQ